MKERKENKTDKMVFDSPPDPMNHVHIFKGHPRQFALWELVLHWHKTFPPDQMDQVEIPSHSHTKLKKLDVQEGKKDKLLADHVPQVREAHHPVIVFFLQYVQGFVRPPTEGKFVRDKGLALQAGLWRVTNMFHLVASAAIPLHWGDRLV